jgi:catechol 2,3-dioxygenase-like lactoylglutathione lyase family enzyme
MDLAGTGMLHHIELWVPDLTRAEDSWGWMLEKLGYRVYQEWPEGCRPGLNHLAFHVSSREELDEVVLHAPDHGWRLLYTDRHPFAGGDDHYAAYLENRDGYEVELVAPS